MFINAISSNFQNREAGCVAPLTHSEPEEEVFLKCQNSVCGKSFAKPLQALDLQASSGETYEACPYCLSKVPASQATAKVQIETLTSKTVTSCLHYLGYLHERSKKVQIPDECMMCKDLVCCMLKDLQK